MLSPVVVVTRSMLAGYTNDNDCMYINGTGQDVYDFYIQVSKKRGIKKPAEDKATTIVEKKEVGELRRNPQLNRCGTLGGSDHSKREVKNTKPTKNYMWNTVTIQYNPLIEEEWDEHFKVRLASRAACHAWCAQVTCEYGYDFWKTVTFPFLEVE